MIKSAGILLLLFISSSFATAQVREISLNVGDSLSLGTCTDSSQFAHIDLMIKTRWPNPDATYDTLSGKGFYNWYFDGDVDSRRLPCSYEGGRFRIAAFHVYANEDGSQRTVIFGQFIDNATVLWIEIEKAIESGEVIP
ncbi:MAG TPA: hypothetical protein DIW47_06980 [Bacteroidetes bacterium]|nr:hypothetical protein [Bacteroidota bacterium]